MAILDFLKYKPLPPPEMDLRPREPMSPLAYRYYRRMEKAFLKEGGSIGDAFEEVARILAEIAETKQ